MRTYTEELELVWAVAHAHGAHTAFVVDVSSWESMIQDIKWRLESGAQYITLGSAVIWP